MDVSAETSRVTSLTIDLPGWRGHRAGQHVDIRLTAEDGYQAVRSYSIASAPEHRHVVVTVERLDDGEVSPYLVDEVRADDQLEVRGPVGGYFVWEVAQGGPLFLIGGGSGIVPLMAMIRHRQAAGSGVPVTLLYSARSPEDIIYREELQSDVSEDVRVIQTLTRSHPPDWSGFTRRIDEPLLREVAPPSEQRPLTYICGPTALVEHAASSMVNLGYEPTRIRTERFGPSGR